MDLGWLEEDLLKSRRKRTKRKIFEDIYFFFVKKIKVIIALRCILQCLISSKQRLSFMANSQRKKQRRLKHNVSRIKFI